MYPGKTPIADFVARYDLVVNVAKVVGGMQPVERVSWPASKGTPDLPWYAHEVPTVFVSVSTPFLLADAPAVKCYINTYDSQPATLGVLVDKLAAGASACTGVSPVDVSAAWRTRSCKAGHGRRHGRRHGGRHGGTRRGGSPAGCRRLVCGGPSSGARKQLLATDCHPARADG